MKQFSDTELLDLIEQHKLEICPSRTIEGQWLSWAFDQNGVCRGESVRQAIQLAVASLVAEKLSPHV